MKVHDISRKNLLTIVSVVTIAATVNVLLPRGRIQEIKCMLLMHLTHGLFLTLTQKSVGGMHHTALP